MMISPVFSLISFDGNQLNEGCGRVATRTPTLKRRPCSANYRYASNFESRPFSAESFRSHAISFPSYYAEPNLYPAYNGVYLDSPIDTHQNGDDALHPPISSRPDSPIPYTAYRVDGHDQVKVIQVLKILNVHNFRTVVIIR